MEQDLVIKNVEQFVEEKLGGEVTGHDHYHSFRVRDMALKIGRQEKADLFIVELGALLHDVGDYKFNNDEEAGSKIVRDLLVDFGLSSEAINSICHIVDNVSFKGAKVENKMKTLEGWIVQDADRLDALGAIGIARAFAYGALIGRKIYDPAIKPVLHESFSEFKNAKSTGINHFYEKCLLLKDLMNTDTGQQLAEKRHEFLENYLEQFLAEWEGRV
jgi:uncharacterized protein